MITSEDTGEVHPFAFVTVKLYVPWPSPDTVVPVPVPVDCTLPGKRVSVHVPVEGKPLIITLPDGTSQVGWVTDPGTGAVGVGGCRLITTLAEGNDVHPAELVTVKV